MRDPQGRNRAHVNVLREQGIDVPGLDVTDNGSVEQAVQSIVAKAGRVDVLINNAGIASAGVSEAFTAEPRPSAFPITAAPGAAPMRS